MSSVIAVKDLSFSYTGTAPWLLENISFTVQEGDYVCLMGANGCGKTTLVNPTLLTVTDGNGIATVVLSSSKYDYMIVDGVKYEPVSNEGGSSFEIPVTALDVKIAVVADTVAMSTPHEIEYTILLDSSTLEELK